MMAEDSRNGGFANIAVPPENFNIQFPVTLSVGYSLGASLGNVPSDISNYQAQISQE